MVNAHLSQMQDSGYVHAIFKTEVGFRVSSEKNKKVLPPLEGIKEQMLFHNRNTIANTLIGFLRQRKHALKNHPLGDVAATLFDVIYSCRMKHFDELVKIIEYQCPKFLQIMPKPESKFHKNFNKNIAPILSFCTGKEINGG